MWQIIYMSSSFIELEICTIMATVGALFGDDDVAKGSLD
jgi:hypothetical protein